MISKVFFNFQENFEGKAEQKNSFSQWKKAGLTFLGEEIVIDLEFFLSFWMYVSYVWFSNAWNSLVYAPPPGIMAYGMCTDKSYLL